MMIIAFGISSILYSSLNTTVISSAYATPLYSSQKMSDTTSNSGNNNATTKSSPNIFPNVNTSFISNTTYPHVDHSAYIHPSAVLIGDCHIGKNVLVAPFAVCRGDTGIPIYVGDFSNIQDGAIIHAAQTMKNGSYIDNKRFSQNGERLLANDTRFSKEGYAVYISGNTTLAHDSLVHGPAWIGNNTMVGMKSIVFDAKVGNNVVIRLGSIVTGVKIADNKLVPIGSVITNQTQADKLPSAIGTSSQNLNQADLLNSQELAEAYRRPQLQSSR